MYLLHSTKVFLGVPPVFSKGWGRKTFIGGGVGGGGGVGVCCVFFGGGWWGWVGGLKRGGLHFKIFHVGRLWAGGEGEAKREFLGMSEKRLFVEGERLINFTRKSPNFRGTGRGVPGEKSEKALCEKNFARESFSRGARDRREKNE